MSHLDLRKLRIPPCPHQDVRSCSTRFCDRRDAREPVAGRGAHGGGPGALVHAHQPCGRRLSRRQPVSFLFLLSLFLFLLLLPPTHPASHAPTLLTRCTTTPFCRLCVCRCLDGHGGYSGHCLEECDWPEGTYTIGIHEFYQAPGSHAVANDTITIGFLRAQAGFECHDRQCGGPTGKGHPLPYSVCASPIPSIDRSGLGRGPSQHDADNQICTASYIELYRLDGNKTYSTVPYLHLPPPPPRL